MDNDCTHSLIPFNFDDDMLEQLFGSKTRVKMLQTFFRQPEHAWYVRELTRALDVQINAVRRELDTLTELNIVKQVEEKPDAQKLKEAKKGKPKKAGANLRKYYMLNKDSMIYSELQSLLVKAQMHDEQAFLESIIEKGGDISLFLITGQLTGDKDSQTDIFLVGKLKPKTIEKAIAAYEKEINLPIRYTLMTKEEFLDRRNMMDKFVYEVFETNHVKVVNTLDS